MTSRYETELLHLGTQHDFAWLVCKGMQDDPMDLYQRLPRMQQAAPKRFLRKVELKSNGEDLPRNQMKVIDFEGIRFLAFKDLSTQTRFLAVKTACKNKPTRTQTFYLIVSGIEGKKEDEIPKGHLTRAKNRWIEVEKLIRKGELKIGGW